MQAVGANDIGCSITGLPGHPAEDIALEDVSVSFSGGGKPEDAQRAVPEQETKYPEYSMFGRLPAYGFYCRHVRGLRLSRVQLAVAKPDARPSLTCDDVADLEVCAWRPASATKANPVVVFSEVQDAFLHSCRAPAGTATYLRVDGKGSGKIKLMANDLVEAEQTVALGPDVSLAAVVVGTPAGGSR